MSVSNPFIMDENDYKIDLDPIISYMDQASTYIAKKKHISKEEAYEAVKTIVKESDAKDPVVKYFLRGDNGDKEETEITLTNYIKTVKKNKEVLVPSFTSCTNLEQKNSLHKDFVLGNLKSRSVEKKKAAKFKAEGNIEKFIFHNTLQKTKKIFNNSLSGAYASKSTILHNPSAHYTLTSVTRAVASIGNAVTEIIVSGNRHYRSLDIVLNHLTATMTGIDREKISKAISKYDLVIPTIDDVMGMIKYSSRLYWSSEKDESCIYDYIKDMDDLDRCAVMYVNDAYHIRKLNDSFMREFIGRLHKKHIGSSDLDIDRLKNSEEYVLNLVHHICSDDIKGMDVNYDTLKGTTTLDSLIATADNINSAFDFYRDFIDAFFVTTILPIDIVYIKELTRRSIVLSDTDSTCGTYGEWVKWFFGDIYFNHKATAVSAVVMTMTTQAIDHYLKVLSANMNVPMSGRDMLKMKNEFFWEFFCPLNTSKHYYANTTIQEGMVFKEPELEIKGAHLISSTIPTKYQKLSKDMMKSIISTVENNKKIDLGHWINYVADLERELMNAVYSGDTGILKTDKIKDKDAYKLSWQQSPYYHYIMWESVFASKYGHSDKPPLTTLKIPTTLKTKRKILDFLDSIRDEELREKFTKFYMENPKDSLGLFRLPHTLLTAHGIPDELKDIIDVNRIVFDILKPFYLILETIGFYRKEDHKLIDMGY